MMTCLYAEILMKACKFYTLEHDIYNVSHLQRGEGTEQQDGCSFWFMKNLRIVLTIIILSIILLALPSWATIQSTITGPNPYTTSTASIFGKGNWGPITGYTEALPAEQSQVVYICVIIRDITADKYWNGSSFVTADFNDFSIRHHVGISAWSGNYTYWSYNGLPYDYSTFYNRHNHQFRIYVAAYWTDNITETQLESWEIFNFTWDMEGPTGTVEIDPQYLISGTSIKYLKSNYYNTTNDVQLNISASDDLTSVDEMEIYVAKGGSHTPYGYIPYQTAMMFNLPEYGEGEYKIWYKFTDSVGNIKVGATTFDYTVDLTSPGFYTFEIDNATQIDGDWYLNSQPIKLNINATDLHPLQMRIALANLDTQTMEYDTTNFIAYQSPFDIPPGPYDDGSFRAVCVIMDEAQNPANPTNKMIDFYIDTTPPLVDTIQPNFSGGYYYTNQAVDLKFKVIDETSKVKTIGIRQIDQNANTIMLYEINNFSDPEILTKPIPMDFSAGEGEYDVEVKTSDMPGNVQTYSIGTVIYDVTPPNVTANIPSVAGPTCNINGTASDSYGVDKVEVKVNNGSYDLATGTTNWNYTISSGLQNGENTIYVKATDKTGNEKIITDTLISDVTPPEEFSAISPINTVYKDNPVIKWEHAEDLLTNIDHYEVFINGTGYTVPGTDNEYLPTAALPEGENTYYITAYDQLNNTKSTELYTFYMDYTPPDATNVTAPSAQAVILGETSPVEWTESTDNSQAFLPADLYKLKYEVYFDGQFAQEVEDATQYNVTAPLTEGDHSVYVKAVDPAGNTSAQSNVRNFYFNESIPVITVSTGGKEMAANEAIPQESEFEIIIKDASGIKENSIKILLDNIKEISISSIQPVSTVAGKVTEYRIIGKLDRIAYEIHSFNAEAEDELGAKGTYAVDFGLSLADIDISIPKAYPNPAKLAHGDVIKIIYSLPQNQDIRLFVYTITGNRVYERLCRAGETENISGIGVVGKGGAQGTNIVTLDDLGTLGNGVYIFLGVDTDGNTVIHGEFGVLD